MRSMAEHTRNVQIEEFLALYAKFSAGAAWLAKRQASGLDNSRHLADFRRLEAQVDKEWENVPDEQKSAILSVLVKRGEFPEGVGRVVKIFGGSIAGIT